MMKQTLVGALALVLGLIVGGCKSTTNNNTTLEKPIVSAAGANAGGTLALSWDLVSGAESYEIKAGDSVYTTTSTSYGVTTPVATIEVRAVKGTVKSDPATVDCKVVEGSAVFYDYRDSTRANGFGFDANGGAIICTLSTAGRSGMDFYADSSHAQMKLVAAHQRQSGFGDQLKAASGSYDNITMADSLGTYSGSLVIMADTTYFLRISPDTTGTWTAGDNFAKARVDSIAGSKVSLTTAYQKIPGLRWLTK